MSAAAQAFTPLGGSPFLAHAIVRTPTATTAQDLLNNVMGHAKNPSDGSRAYHESTAAQPQLLFGSGSNPSLPGHSSIWSMSHDSDISGTYQHSPPTQTFHMRQKSISPPSRPLQLSWSTPRADTAHNSAQHGWPVSRMSHNSPNPHNNAISPGHQRHFSGQGYPTATYRQDVFASQDYDPKPVSSTMTPYASAFTPALHVPDRYQPRAETMPDKVYDHRVNQPFLPSANSIWGSSVG